MGVGAFATTPLPIGFRIPYVGESISYTEYQLRLQNNEDEYLLNSGTAYQDSKHQRSQGEYGSAVNSPLHAWNFKSNGPAIANVELGYSAADRTFFWRSIKVIRAGDEILGSYGSSYRLRYKVGRHQLAIPTRLLSPFAMGSHQIISERLRRLVVDHGELSLLWHKAPPHDPHFYDGLTRTILQRDMEATQQLLRQANCTFRIRLRTESNGMRKLIPSNGYCGWLTAMHCAKANKAPNLPRKIDWVSSRPQLLEWLNLRLVALEATQEHPLGEEKDRLLATMRSTIQHLAAGVDSLPQESWLKTGHFIWVDTDNPTHLWHKREDLEIYLDGATVALPGDALTLNTLGAITQDRMGGLYSNGHYDLYRNIFTRDKIDHLVKGMLSWIHQQIIHDQK